MDGGRGPARVEYGFDRLSHPSMAADVARDAADAGLRVVWLTVPPWMFTVLRAASLLPMGTDDANWRP